MLPDGVVARMQLSPYRIQLAGIQTAPAEFRPLARELESSGVVAREQGAATVVLEMSAAAGPVGRGGASGGGCLRGPAGPDPMAGRVRSVARRPTDGWEHLRARSRSTNPPRELRSGMIAVVTHQGAVAALEPFRSLPPIRRRSTPGEPRRVYVCPDHPDATALEPGRCPIDNETARGPAARRATSGCAGGARCTPTSRPIRPARSAARAAAWSLQPRVVSYRPAGQVLAVPRVGGRRHRAAEGRVRREHARHVRRRRGRRWARAAATTTRSSAGWSRASGSRPPARSCSTPRRGSTRASPPPTSEPAGATAAAAPVPTAPVASSGDTGHAAAARRARARGPAHRRAPEALSGDRQGARLDGHARRVGRLGPGRLPLLRRLPGSS